MGVLSMNDVVSIIAGGASVRKAKLKKIPGYRIGVNDSFIHAQCDMAFSMDRLWTENRWMALCYEAKPVWIRDSACKSIQDRPGWLNTFRANIDSFKPSSERGLLNGNNSGLCAVNLVYQMDPPP